MNEPARAARPRPAAAPGPKRAYNVGVSLPRFTANDILMSVAGYGTVALVGVVSWFALSDPLQRWGALGLLSVFSVLCYYFGTAHGQAHTHQYLAMQTLVVSVLTLTYPETSLFNVLFFILSAHSMLCLPVRQAVPWIVLFCVITAVGGVLSMGWIGILHVLPNFGGYAFFATFGNLLRMAHEDKARSQRLLEELRAAQSQLKELAVAEERNRLAREMHDSLGHRLTVAVVQLEGAQRLIPTDPERASRMIGAMREHMKEALADVRRAVATLRTAPKRADDLPLDSALDQLVGAFRDGTGIAVHLDLDPGLPALPEPHRLALYRAAQESLTNALRHADAGQVWLSVRVENGSLILVTADDGKGFPDPQHLNGGFGLRGLKERADQLGGALTLEARPGGGAQVRFVLPVQKNGEEQRGT